MFESTQGGPELETGAYARAKRRGLKAVHATQHYLPVLDELVPDRMTLSTMNLGIITVPLDRVVGTVTKGRTLAFAENFMPLLDEDTEFAQKWMVLANSVKKSGMREPVKLLEYMNRYYALEGNKRISVMKFLDSIFIEAEVTRLIPHRTEAKENKAYFEYLDFYKDTKINYLELTGEGAYARLTELVGQKPGVPWDEDALMNLRVAYNQFAESYDVFGGDLLKTGTGDAFLIYLNAFGYDPKGFSSSAAVRANLGKLRGEFRMREQAEPLSLKMTAEETKPGLIKQILRPSISKLSIGFVNHRPPETSGWTYWHMLGCHRIKSVFGEKISTRMMSVTDLADCESMIDELADGGADMVFTTSPLLLGGAHKAALKHPDLKILNCSLVPVYSSVRSYYLRIFEAKYIMGAIAGAMAENDRVGYIADYPVYGIPASINAFALGATLTNPRAKVYLEWSTLRDGDPERALAEKGVNVISNRDIAALSHESDAYGVYMLSEGRKIKLAQPIWNWGQLYEDLIRRVFNSTYDEDSKDSRALNYWWGMDSGAIDVFYSSDLPAGLKRLTNVLRRHIREHQTHIFTNTIVDQGGALRCGEGETLTPAQVLSMDFLAENVIGDFPETDALRDSARDFVKMQGVRDMRMPEVTEFCWNAKHEDP